jgi:extracellular elastinolytic metalloproteinase
VLPITKEYPTAGFETLTNPEDSTSSPYGWLSTTGSTQSTTTSGNNAYAYVGSTPASQSASGQFVYTYTVGGTPTATANKNAAIVNAFYVVNKIHDITYRYGFTEAAYNFQTTNVSRPDLRTNTTSLTTVTK